MPTPIEDVLDRCIERRRSGGNLEDILREAPDAAATVRPLLALTSQLEALPAPQPSVEALTRLIAEMAAVKPARPRVSLFSAAVIARAAVILFALLLLGWGATAASSNTVPGDWLYPVKLLTERARFLLAVNAEDRVELRIVFSEERLKEAVRKHAGGEGVDKALLSSMLDEARRALDAAPSLDSDTRPLAIARIAYLGELQASALNSMKTNSTPADLATLAACEQRCSEHCAAACRMLSGSVMRCPMRPPDNAPASQ